MAKFSENVHADRASGTEVTKDFEELGKADSEDLGSGPTDLPQMFRKDESHQRDRGSGHHKRDPQAPGIMGGETPSPAQSHFK